MSGRILGKNLLKASGIVSEVTTSGYPAKNLVNGRTSNQAGFTYGVTGEVVFDLGSSVNYSGKTLGIGIAKHNLGNTTSTLTIAFSADNSTYSGSTSFNITTNFPQILELSYSSSFQYVRIRVTNNDSQAYVSDLTFNEVIDIQSGQPVGYSSPFWSLGDEVISNVTRGGELAGVTIINKPKQFKINISKVDMADTVVMPALLNIMFAGAFYFKWATLSEDGIDGEVTYCWVKNKMPQIKHDTVTTVGTVIDCEGIVW